MISASKPLFLFQKKPFIIILAIMLLVCAAYGLSLNNGFVWDDETLIVNNTYVHTISKWPQYFTLAGTVSNDPVMSRVYRPLQTLSFALDAALWGNWAGGFHLTSLLLHLATCFALFYAFNPLVGHRSSIVAAILFSIHPALSESVLSLASRGNQLYTLLALLSLGFFVRTAKPFDKYHLLSLFAALTALFSKEPAIAYLALLPLFQLVFRQPWNLRDRRSAALFVPFVVIAGLYLSARAMVVASAQVVPYWGGSLGATLVMQAKVFILYLRLLFWPFYLQGRYHCGARCTCNGCAYRQYCTRHRCYTCLAQEQFRKVPGTGDRMVLSLPCAGLEHYPAARSHDGRTLSLFHLCGNVPASHRVL